MAGQKTARRGEEQPRPPSGPPSPAEDENEGTGQSRTGRRSRCPSPGGIIISALAAALLGAAAFWLLYGSAWVRVERVTTAGGVVLTPDELRRAASVPLDAPLVSVDTDAVAARLRERLPRLDSAEAERQWPHTIRLNVTERKPELLLEKGGKFIEVDGEGVPYATVDRAPERVPLLDLDASDSPSLRRFPAGRLRREAVRVAARLPAAVHRDTRVVRVRSYDSVTLELTGGRTVVWGSSERADEKARTLLALMKTARNAEHFDVSIPSAPAVSGS